MHTCSRTNTVQNLGVRVLVFKDDICHRSIFMMLPCCPAHDTAYWGCENKCCERQDYKQGANREKGGGGEGGWGVKGGGLDEAEEGEQGGVEATVQEKGGGRVWEERGNAESGCKRPR